MSGRIEKQNKPSKTEQRIALASLIDRVGSEVMPCSRCFDRSLNCQMMEGISRCKECVRAGRSCDGLGVPIDTANNIVSEDRRLEKEELLAEEQLLEVRRRHDIERKRLDGERKRLDSELDTALGRLTRLRKQRRFLKERGIKVVQRGLQSLDELDEMERMENEEKERKEREKRNAMPLPSGGQSEVLPRIDWDALDAAWEVDPSLLAPGDQGVDGETDPQQLRQSPNVS